MDTKKFKSTFRKIANLLSPEDITLLISRQEEVILEVKIKMEEMYDQYQAALNVVKRYTDFEDTHKKENLLLEKLVQYKTGKITEQGETTKVYTKLSNATAQKNRPRIDFKIVAEAVNLVTKNRVAYDPKSLVKLMENMSDVFATHLKDKPWGRASAAQTLTRTTKLVLYNNKLGLPEWFDKSGSPKTNYIQLFMH